MGNRPFELKAAGTLRLAGLIDGSGANAVQGPGGGGARSGASSLFNGGGGGRIAYQYETLMNRGTASVKGGLSGVSGVFGHGFKSPEAHGDRGVITKEKLP